jgi:iron complex outermembrane receptor protein
MAPNVQVVQPNGPSSYNLNIRGVVQTDFGDHQEAPVSLYVDEVYISQMSAAGFALFDLERVEILRGPQGTLFGRNATGGLAHFVTQKPTRELDGYVTATYGDYDWYRIEGAVGGPLTDIVSARFSGEWNQHDPYIKNRIGKDLNNGDDFALRGQVLFDFSDSTHLLLNIRHAEEDIDSGLFKHRAGKPTDIAGGVFLAPGEDYWTGANAENPAFGDEGYLGGVPAPVSCAGCDAFGYGDPDKNPYVGSYDFIGFNVFKTTSGTVTLNTSIGDLQFKSITDFTTMKKKYQEDSDASPNSVFDMYVTADVDQFSQEFQLSGESENRRWVTGLYYLSIRGDYSIGGEIDAFEMGSFPGGGLSNPFSTDTDSYAAFAQLEQDMSEAITLIAGIRYTREEKKHEYHSNFVAFPEGWAAGDPAPDGDYILAPLFDYSSASVGSLAQLKQDLWSSKLELDWRATDDSMVYVSWNRGVKGGGFNAPMDPTGLLLEDGTQSNEEMRYQDETLDAFEIGFKSLLGDGAVRINGAAFYYDYSDYQAFRFIGLTQTVFNADAEIYGMDLEIAARPVEGLDLLFGIGLVDTTVKDLDFGFGLVDRDTAFSPNLNMNGLARYSWPMGTGALAIQADFHYLGDHNFNLVAPPVLQEGSYTVANARLSYQGTDERWEVAVFVDNFTDTEYRVQGFDVTLPPPVGFGMVQEYYGKPRWWGVSFTCNFE